MTTRLLTLRDVTAMTALSRSAVYALMAESRFPKPIRIGSRAVQRPPPSTPPRRFIPQLATDPGTTWPIRKTAGQRTGAMSTTYFSEREHGPRPRTEELISPTVRRALLSQIEVGIGNGACGLKFAAQCDDGYGPYGTDEQAFWDTAMAEVPDLPIPDDSSPGRALRSAEDVDTVVVLDLLEFCARAVAQPIQRGYHSYFGHHHLDFDRDAGLTDFVNDVNRLFRLNGIGFELSEDGEARRLGAPGLQEALREPEFNTGDEETDRLLRIARERIVLPRDGDRRDALEKLWDAFERIKTIESGGNKRAQADRLLDRTTSSPRFREFLSQEAKALTEIGNSLRIRHSETTQERVQTLEQIDYLFHRMFSFLRLVLRATGRGG